MSERMELFVRTHILYENCVIFDRSAWSSKCFIHFFIIIIPNNLTQTWRVLELKIKTSWKKLIVLLGEHEGRTEGSKLGLVDGITLGLVVGNTVGELVLGLREGLKEGKTEGVVEGLTEGMKDGPKEGATLGVTEGLAP